MVRTWLLHANDARHPTYICQMKQLLHSCWLYLIEASHYWCARALLWGIRAIYWYRDESLARLIISAGKNYLRRPEELDNEDLGKLRR